jgi:hypothetical protein
MPAVGGCLRTRYRCIAVGEPDSWQGFPKHARSLADTSSCQRVFSDKVQLPAGPHLLSLGPPQRHDMTTTVNVRLFANSQAMLASPGGNVICSYSCGFNLLLCWQPVPLAGLHQVSRESVGVHVACAQVAYSRVGRAGLLRQLREHLQRNIVKLGGTWYYQSQGIPQVALSPRQSTLHTRNANSAWDSSSAIRDGRTSN